MPNQNNNEEWRTELEKVLPKLSERSWKKIASQISQAKQQGKREGLEEARDIAIAIIISSLGNQVSECQKLKNQISEEIDQAINQLK